ncbi:right-handed parallel beta-helix repeat-containing protein [Cellulophaga baltica]|uniref:right-handed parallel beta-helix repeat-containing protein n=1 Tax=Cellulophaga TaxID=104264 RepID=UPI001C0710F4|nr:MULTISPECIES: right-handed parallel beta-helix repeat-containing protein [Cellulophaga]MBU2996745.1 right-handed parallel beta-helix repeat-containing protein [Cellulophaga baltica]MDO6768141.1 right-handed parallel beta-helix repeat-containing protein [Cellulophaga sp. 1_MG-2023]
MSKLFKTLCIVSFTLKSVIVFGQVKKMSDFYKEGEDKSITIKRALLSNYDSIIVDKSLSPWEVSPIVIVKASNKVILFEKGATVLAKNNAYPKLGDAMIELKNCKDLSFIGDSTVLKMNKEEYVEGEWRHVISLRGSEDISFKNMILRDSGGDGIYIAGSKEKKFSENIYIDNVNSVNNKRQGMSIISAKNVFVSNSKFSETKGALPEAGLDIEPNTSEDLVVNINFENCEFYNNYHAGVKLALGKLNAESTKIAVLFTNCLIENNHNESNRYAPAELVFGADKDSPVKGNVLFEDCLVKNSQWPLIYSRKTSNAYSVHFKNCFVENVAQKKDMPIISFEVPDYKNKTNFLGGYKFEDLTIKTKMNSPIIQIRGSKLGTLKGVDNLVGNIILLSEKNNKLYNYINYSSFLNENVNIDIIRRIN